MRRNKRRHRTGVDHRSVPVPACPHIHCRDASRRANEQATTHQCATITIARQQHPQAAGGAGAARCGISVILANRVENPNKNTLSARGELADRGAPARLAGARFTRFTRFVKRSRWHPVRETCRATSSAAERSEQPPPPLAGSDLARRFQSLAKTPLRAKWIWPGPEGGQKCYTLGSGSGRDRSHEVPGQPPLTEPPPAPNPY